MTEDGGVFALEASTDTTTSVMEESSEEEALDAGEMSSADSIGEST